MDIEQKFRAIESFHQIEAIEDRSTFWEQIFDLIRKNADLVLERKSLIKLGEILVDNLLNRGADDFTTVKQVMAICALEMGWNSICKRDKIRTFTRILSPSSKFNWRIHKKCRFSGLRLLDLAIQRTDVKVTTLLVKYGLFEISDGNIIIFHDVSVAESALQEFSCTTCLFGLNLEIDMDMCSHMAKRLVNQLRKSNFNFRRIQLVLRVLDAVTCKRIDSETDDCVQCIKLFFATVTDPFVTKSEVNFFLRYLFRYESSNVAADILSEDYADLFPTEALGPLEPRKLVHLCRCSIRKFMIKNSGLLPKIVNDLNIPRSLKSYILAECDV